MLRYTYKQARLNFLRNAQSIRYGQRTAKARRTHKGQITNNNGFHIPSVISDRSHMSSLANNAIFKYGDIFKFQI